MERSADEEDRSSGHDSWSPVLVRTPESDHSSIGSFINDGHISNESWTSSEYVMRRVLANSPSSSSEEEERVHLPDSPVQFKKGPLKRKLLISDSEEEAQEEKRTHLSGPSSSSKEAVCIVSNS